MNIVNAVEHCHEVGAKVLGLVGRADGTTAQLADACVVFEGVPDALLTPIVEGLQAVVWHALAFHPRLILHEGKWEAILHASDSPGQE
jgi:D-sedoheptulose 7-phosphate isomerase